MFLNYEMTKEWSLLDILMTQGGASNKTDKYNAYGLTKVWITPYDIMNGSRIINSCITLTRSSKVCEIKRSAYWISIVESKISRLVHTLA